MHVHICTGKHVPRAVFVDLEPTVIDEVSGGQARLETTNKDRGDQEATLTLFYTHRVRIVVLRVMVPQPWGCFPFYVSAR
jgi:hypothetical protein